MIELCARLLDWLKANPFAHAMVVILLIVSIVVALDLLSREGGRE
jgi:hypothetical protein